jgi:hypothetical protein
METSRESPDARDQPGTRTENQFTFADIDSLLRESGWLKSTNAAAADSRIQLWLERAAELLGPQVVDREDLKRLLSLICEYDAAKLLKDGANQSVVARTGVREVIRELARLVLDGPDIDSDRFKEIIENLKSSVPYRSRDMFQPIRLALAGCAGEGELDRVILLLDSASNLDFAIPVKGTRQRRLEFCTALD